MIFQHILGALAVASVPALFAFLFWLKKTEDAKIKSEANRQEWVLNIQIGFNEWLNELKTKRGK